MDVSLYFDTQIETNGQIVQHYDCLVGASQQITQYYDTALSIPYHNVRMESVNISLGSKTLSDTYSLQTRTQVANPKLDDVMTGTILDMPYRFKVDERSVSGSQISLTGRYDMDKLLYTAFAYSLDKNDSPGTHDGKWVFLASQYLESIASHLGLTPKMYFHDWPVKPDGVPSDGTYQQFMQSLFGWRGELPHIDINVFIRGNNLFAIERDWEQDAIADGYGRIVALRDGVEVVRVPTIVQTRRRTEWTGTVSKPRGPYSSNDIVADNDQDPFTGTVTFGDAELYYLDGYLQYRIEGSKRTDYTYIDIDGKKYLQKEETIDTEEETANKTEYEYEHNNGIVYLSVEKRYTDGEYNTETHVPDYTDAVIIKTTHTPLLNGFWGTTTINEDTEEVMTSLNAGGGAASTASQYMIDRQQEAMDTFNATTREMIHRILASLFGTPIINTNFPLDSVFGGTVYQWLAQECDWLNNKIEERITAEIVGLSHVIDFTDLISYRGHYYSLENNSVTVSPRGTRQAVQMVRWFNQDDQTESTPTYEEW